MRQLTKEMYRLEYDENTGEVTGLFDRGNPTANWIAEAADRKFGTVFLHGTQWQEDEIPFASVQETENGILCRSVSGATSVAYYLEDDRFRIQMKTNRDCGPRMGLQLNLNLLDLPTAGTWQTQCMPKVIYTDDENAYAYFVFGTADGRYLGVAVNDVFAAWRIKYSYDGHRMTGFQILSQADDVKCGQRMRLPETDRLSVTVLFADSLNSCLEKIACQLGISIAWPEVSGAPAGGVIPLRWLNGQAGGTVIGPDGKECAVSDVLEVTMPGTYILRTVNENGRKHDSRVLCHESWQEIYARVNEFYRAHFQDECGAFYRVIRKDSLKPEGKTFEGVEFGDPNAHFSCRTGEFGGFAPWAMLKNCLLFGENQALLESIRRYTLNWALNRGHEDKPFYGTVYKQPAEYNGRSYSGYHLFEELNYLQHEAFLLEELADYVRLTDDLSVLDDAVALAEHMISDHLENGALINENSPGHKVDYTTVHSTVSGFIALGRLLQERGHEKAQIMCQTAEAIADHVCRRGLDFPTEGEPCTEDGSMSCSAITLLRAYLEIAPKEEYLKTAEAILRAHQVLELNGSDCRMRNSSLRFWETQYESNDWGPSINAGHAWSIWNAEAKALYAKATGNFDSLKASYEGFVTNMCKVEPNGGMSSCYTPDMIPGTPHAYYLNDHPVDVSVDDERKTSVILGGRYVPGAYATSGNFFLIRAAETFAQMSGLDGETAVNGRLENGVFTSAAPKFNYLLLKNPPERLTVCVRPGEAFTLAFDGVAGHIQISGGEIQACQNGEYLLQPQTDNLEIRVQAMGA